MSIKLFSLIFFSVALSAIAQISLRHGMINPALQEILNNENSSKIKIIFSIMMNPYVISGLTMYGLGAFVWLFVLSKIEVSTAYPFVGIGFIITMILGVFMLNESVSAVKIVGTLLVAAGVVLVSNS